MLCCHTFMAIIQYHNSTAEGETVTVFPIWSNTGLLKLPTLKLC